MARIGRLVLRPATHHLVGGTRVVWKLFFINRKLGQMQLFRRQTLDVDRQTEADAGGFRVSVHLGFTRKKEFQTSALISSGRGLFRLGPRSSPGSSFPRPFWSTEPARKPTLPDVDPGPWAQGLYRFLKAFCFGFHCFPTANGISCKK